MTQLKNLIVGVDPGTTIGYAALDLDGNVVLLGSGKGLDRDKVVALLVDAGDPLVIGTDKLKVPSLVAEIATRFGARVASPSHDLLVTEKRALTTVGRNDHETDALASALFAANQVRSLVDKVRKHASEGLFERVARLVMKDGLSIHAAIDVLMLPQAVPARTVDDVLEERRLEKRDFVKVWNELASNRRELALLKEQNRKVLNALDRVKREKHTMRQRAQNPRDPSPGLLFKDKRIDQLHRMVQDAERQFAVFRRKVEALESVLARQDLVVLKKMPTLGSSDFGRLRRSLRIQPGDNLYVEDCDVHSAQVLDALRGVVGVVVAGKPVSRKLERELPFIVVSAVMLPLEHLDRFVVVPKAVLQRAIAGKQVLSRVIEEYKQERARD